MPPVVNPDEDNAENDAAEDNPVGERERKPAHGVSFLDSQADAGPIW